MEKESKWSQKYKNSIDCSNPKGFSQRAHCQGLKKKKKSKASILDSLNRIAIVIIKYAFNTIVPFFCLYSKINEARACNFYMGNIRYIG